MGKPEWRGGRSGPKRRGSSSDPEPFLTQASSPLSSLSLPLSVQSVWRKMFYDPRQIESLQSLPLRSWVSGGDHHENSRQCPAWKGDCPGIFRGPYLRFLGEVNSGTLFLPSLFPGGSCPWRYRNGLFRKLGQPSGQDHLCGGTQSMASPLASPQRKLGLLMPWWLPLLGRRC